MRIRWRGFELPTRVICEEETKTDTYARFIAEPFERGFGTTVGNSLRRALLSSIEGAAAFSVHFQGVQHEFSTLPGIVEDVAEIILNIKSLVVKMHTDGVKTLKIDKHKPGDVTGADILCDADVEIIDKKQHIATITEETHFVGEIQVKRGRGYTTAEDNDVGEQEIGVIPIDSHFSPVTRVEYRIEDSRVGQRVNYDRLLMQVWTNGSISPEDAMVEASKIIRKHLNAFVQYYEIGEQMLREGAAAGTRLPAADQAELIRKLDMPVTELELSVRASNCLQAENIKTIREIVTRTKEDMLAIRNFGKTSLSEIEDKLAELGLSLGMDLKEVEC
ncbi:MAG: DNA-directed RNA polymerase subunit alpha [Planctomycetes bacterium]|nr:DNA-directed RNA polymerase subunit alpha [Planctomycetota bacterium]